MSDFSGSATKRCSRCNCSLNQYNKFNLCHRCQASTDLPGTSAAVAKLNGKVGLRIGRSLPTAAEARKAKAPSSTRFNRSF